MECVAILPSDVVSELAGLISIELIDETVTTMNDKVDEETETEMLASEDSEFVSCETLICAKLTTAGDVNSDLVSHDSQVHAGDGGKIASADNFAAEQLADLTLAEAFKCAGEGRDGYFKHRDILYHKDRLPLHVKKSHNLCCQSGDVFGFLSLLIHLFLVVI
jgi:hypothetical protein